MRVVFLQHVAFEGPARLMNFFEPRHDVKICHVYLGDPLPQLADFDWLVAMGGPMGACDDNQFAWMKPEKELIARAIEDGKRVLGICLGAQLMAAALGATVTKNPHLEIGWFPVERCPDLAQTPLGGIIPEVFEAFHWHGDTFSIPAGAIRIGGSDACTNQGFFLNDRVAALQFHLESTSDSVDLLLRNCADELDVAPASSGYVQNAAQIRGTRNQFERIHELQDRLLRYLAQQSTGIVATSTLSK